MLHSINYNHKTEPAASPWALLVNELYPFYSFYISLLFE